MFVLLASSGRSCFGKSTTNFIYISPRLPFSRKMGMPSLGMQYAWDGFTVLNFTDCNDKSRLSSVFTTEGGTPKRLSFKVIFLVKIRSFFTRWKVRCFRIRRVIVWVIFPISITIVWWFAIPGSISTSKFFFFRTFPFPWQPVEFGQVFFCTPQRENITE